MSQTTNEPSVLVLTPRGRGRPRTVCVNEPDGSRVTTYVPASYHDRLIKLAKQRDQTVAQLVRSFLPLRLP